MYKDKHRNIVFSAKVCQRAQAQPNEEEKLSLERSQGEKAKAFVKTSQKTEGFTK